MKRTSIYTQIGGWMQSVFLYDRIQCHCHDKHGSMVRTGTVTYIHPEGRYYNVTFDHGITRSVLTGVKSICDTEPLCVVGRVST